MEFSFFLTVNWWITPSLHLLSMCFLVLTSLYLLTYFFCLFAFLFRNWTFSGTHLIWKMEKGVCNTNLKMKTLWSSKEGFLLCLGAVSCRSSPTCSFPHTNQRWASCGQGNLLDFLRFHKTGVSSVSTEGSKVKGTFLFPHKCSFVGPEKRHKSDL